MGLGNSLLVEQELLSPKEPVGALNASEARPLTGAKKVLRDLEVGDVEPTVMQNQAALPRLTE